MKTQILNIKNIFSLNYHPKLLKILITFTLLGVFSANILSPLLFTYILYDVIPHFYIYIWLFLHFLVFTGRIFSSKKLDYHLKMKSESVPKYLKMICMLTTMTTILFGLAVWYSHFYGATDLQIFTIAVILISLAAGALATLVSIYHLFTLYIVLSMTPLITMLLYHGGEMFILFAFVLLFSTIAILRAGYAQYSTLKNLIFLEEEQEVSAKKIEQLNQSLESKIKLEVARNREKDQLMLRQSRLAQMGEMLSMIAHQWRQPLAAISATSATIEMKAQTNNLEYKDIQKKAHNISDYSQHLSRTIEDFRGFFKPDKEKISTNYDEIIISVLGIMESSLANYNILLHKELSCHSTFMSYPSEIKQVLLNLLSNAKEAIKETQTEDPFIKITTYSKDNKYILEVSDNAGGVPKKIEDKIFDPYFSTKKAKDGTGLGLYMSKMIIEEHCNGTIEFTNITKGALFRISLNMASDDRRKNNG